jgi:hypothetical protein
MNTQETESDSGFEIPPDHRNLDHERFDEVACKILRFVFLYFFFFYYGLILAAVVLGWVSPARLGLPTVW